MIKETDFTQYIESCDDFRVERENVRPVAVLKFGGSSLQKGDNAEKELVSYVEHYQQDNQVVVVVSALKGVTNQLESLYQKRVNKDVPGLWEEFEQIQQRHEQFISELSISSLAKMEMSDRLLSVWDRLAYDVTDGVSSAEIVHDAVLSYGERASAIVIADMLSYAFQPAQAFDATGIIVTDDTFGSASPFLEETKIEHVQQALGNGIIPIVTGFIGATKDGQTTTLGRNSSDFTAAIMARAMGATQLVVVKDVPGLLDEKGEVISEITKDNVFQVRGGTKVVCSPALQLIDDAVFEIRVKPSKDPRALGTRIYQSEVLFNQG